MNRHFTDARYYLGRTMNELRRGLRMGAASVRDRLPGREAEEDRMDRVRSVVANGRSRIERVAERAVERGRSIR